MSERHSFCLAHIDQNLFFFLIFSKEKDNDELLKKSNLIFCKNLNFGNNWENLVHQFKLMPALYGHKIFQYKIYSVKLSLLTEYDKIQ